MLAKLHTFSLLGIEAVPVDVEVDVSQAAMPKTILVGLPEAEVKESTHRVERAIVNSGFQRPHDHVVINLAPAELPKNAASFDLPISGGFWTCWIPNAICQRWPVCWWVLNVVDRFSRRSVGFAVFKCRPASEEVTAALDQIMDAEQIRPKHLIVDQGSKFKCKHFEDVWCEARKILPRFGAVGKCGSIAVVERFHRTLKEILRAITIPEDQTEPEREARLAVDWYNEHRPHETLGGKTPNEVHFARSPANEQPRIEPRRKWPRGSPCAKPQVAAQGNPGDAMILEIDYHEGRRHLPIIRVRPAA